MNGLAVNLKCLMAIALFCSLLAPFSAAHAHPLAPALLQLQQTDANTWQVLWRHSRLLSSRAPPEPIVPAHCARITPVELTAEVGSAIAARWELRCEPVELTGTQIGIGQLEQSPINVIVRLRDKNGEEFQTLLDAENTRFIVPAQASAVWPRYLRLGADHLLFGPDHLLFLLALILLVTGLRALALTLTAFTLGHSVTLSLAALGVISISPALMELGIAVSLIVVARELLSKRRSLLGRHPASMAFAFGLLHGLGFAGALASIGLPTQALVPALLAFNIGIEVGQLLVVTLVYILLSIVKLIWTGKDARLSAAGAMGCAYLVGSVAFFWCLERAPAALAWL